MIECLCAIWLSVASYHTNRDYPYNEVNPGLIVDKGSATYGLYYNSHHRWTGLLAYNHNLVQRTDVQVSVVAGVVSGYASPIAAALRIRVGQHAGIWLVPRTSHNSGVIALTWKLQ